MGSAVVNRMVFTGVEGVGGAGGGGGRGRGCGVSGMTIVGVDKRGRLVTKEVLKSLQICRNRNVDNCNGDFVNNQTSLAQRLTLASEPDKKHLLLCVVDGDWMCSCLVPVSSSVRYC